MVQRCVTEGSRYLQCISFDYLITAAWMLGIALGLGLTGVGFAAPIASAGSLIVGMIYFATGRWKRRRIKGLDQPLDPAAV